MPPEPVRVDPLMEDLGAVDGHRIVLLSIEVYAQWADLRFARIDDPDAAPMPRRVPAADAWTVRTDDGPLEVRDAIGRGDRSFSNGEVRVAPPPSPGDRLHVGVTVLPGTSPLTATIHPGADVEGD